jgi:hypothetical protein
MVADDGGGAIGLGAQAAADLLTVEREALRWAQQDAATHHGRIEAFRDDFARREHADVPRAQAVHHVASLVRRHGAVNGRGRDPAVAEAERHVLGVGDSAAERDRRARRHVPDVVLNDVAGDGVAIEHIGEVGGVVVTRGDAHIAEVNRSVWRQMPERREMAGVDEVAHVGSEHHHIERIAQSDAIEALRSCGDAEHFRVGPRRGDLAPGPCDGVVRLVHHQQRGLWDVRQPGRNCPHHRDLDDVVHARMAGLDAPVRYAHGAQCSRNLVGNFGAVREDDDAVALSGRMRDDERENHRLSAARGQHVEDAAVLGEGGADVGHALVLISAQFEHSKFPSALLARNAWSDYSQGVAATNTTGHCLRRKRWGW